MSRIEEVKEKAKTIIRNTKIKTIIDDMDVINKLYDIINLDNIDVEKSEVMLSQIELYMLMKQKVEEKEKNFSYLKELSKELKQQKIRKDDNIRNAFI